MKDILLACILGVFLIPIVGLFVMPWVYMFRNNILLSSAKRKVAKGKMHSVQAKLLESNKATNFIKNPQSRYSNRKSCIYTYEFNGVKYNYFATTFREPPKEITLYFSDPIIPMGFGQSHLQEPSGLFGAYRIATTIVFAVMVMIMTISKSIEG